MLISNKLHSFRNFTLQSYKKKLQKQKKVVRTILNYYLCRCSGFQAGHKPRTKTDTKERYEDRIAY